MADKQQYRTLRELRYPTDAKIVKRILAGENVPMHQRGMKKVPAGAVVSDIPKESVPVLLEKGWIEAVNG